MSSTRGRAQLPASSPVPASPRGGDPPDPRWWASAPPGSVPGLGAVRTVRLREGPAGPEPVLLSRAWCLWPSSDARSRARVPASGPYAPSHASPEGAWLGTFSSLTCGSRFIFKPAALRAPQTQAADDRVALRSRSRPAGRRRDRRHQSAGPRGAARRPRPPPPTACAQHGTGCGGLWFLEGPGLPRPVASEHRSQPALRPHLPELPHRALLLLPRCRKTRSFSDQRPPEGCVESCPLQVL